MWLLSGHISAFILIYIGYQAGLYLFIFVSFVLLCFVSEETRMNTFATTLLLTALKMSYRLHLIEKPSIVGGSMKREALRYLL